MSATVRSHVVAGNPPGSATETGAYYPALDGLRAIAFLMVFLQHYVSLPWGWAGVNIFFVLSGFLITGILFDTRDKPHHARNFYIRRTLRIFPLYYAIFAVLVLVHPLVHWEWSLAWVAWPLYVGNFLRFVSPEAAVRYSPLETAADAHGMTHRFPKLEINMGHFWSLCVEEQFYLFWPWIVFCVRRRSMLLWICITAVVIVPLVRFAATYVAPQWMLHEEILYRLTPFQLDSLLLGGLVALLWRGAHRDRLEQVARVLVPVLLGITLAYFAYTLPPFTLSTFRYYEAPSWRLPWGLTFVNVFSAALIVGCLNPGTWVAQLLKLPMLRWIGRISYGAYVFHDIFHHFYGQVVGHTSRLLHAPVLLRHIDVSTSVVGLPSTLLISWLSYRFFESPFLRMKDRLTAPSKRKALPA